MRTFEFDAELVEELSGCAPVRLSAHFLVDPRAFKHVSHPLENYVERVEDVVGDDVWELRDVVWRNLVTDHLVPRLNVTVTLGAGSYNSAYARFVNGLTDNEDRVGFCEVTVPSQVVAEAFAAAASGYRAPLDSGPEGVCVLDDGWAGLVGRRVSVTVSATDVEVVGRLLAVRDDLLVIHVPRDGDELVVIPSRAVAYVSTWQFSRREEQAIMNSSGVCDGD